ncbi:MAG: hypothetical protein WC860_00310 [Candidatus Margulisiibacteriota bacterium]|jgi:hypothetical protein
MHLPGNQEQNKDGINFPIIYGKNKISKDCFYSAIKTLEKKFKINFDKAYDLASDIVLGADPKVRII